MKVTCKALNPDVLQLELTISMNIAEWRHAMENIGDTRISIPGDKLKRAIRDAIAEYTNKVELERSIRNELA